MPSAQAPGDVRLRRWIDAHLPHPVWPEHFNLNTMTPADAQDVHALLDDVFSDEEPDFARWWAMRAGDPEYDASAVWLARDGEGRLAGLCWCWSTGFLKDLAVSPHARRNGLAEALVLTAMASFRLRGIAHMDLKTNLSENAEAVKLYEKLGFVEVDWQG